MRSLPCLWIQRDSLPAVKKQKLLAGRKSSVTLYLDMRRLFFLQEVYDRGHKEKKKKE